MLLASVCGCGKDRPLAESPTTPTPIAVTPPAPARVQGVVLDFQTARPIAGAVVGFAMSLGVNNAPVGMNETAVSDANGRYSLSEPPARASNQPYYFIVDDHFAGSGFPRATHYRADVAVDRGQCIARYGMVLDSQTREPIVGATARNLSNVLKATTDKDGWYHIDFGCGVTSLGFNTTWHIMSHPDYKDANFLSGRGISGNFREDVLLTPK